jgi:hypothetical protein
MHDNGGTHGFSLTGQKIGRRQGNGIAFGTAGVPAALARLVTYLSQMRERDDGNW